MKLRIRKTEDAAGNPWPWLLYMYNPETQDYSDEFWSYKTHEDAIKSMPRFFRVVGLPIVLKESA